MNAAKRVLTPAQRLDWLGLAFDYFGIFLEWMCVGYTPAVASRQIKNARESHDRALRCLENIR